MLVYILISSFSLLMSFIYDRRSGKNVIFPYIVLYIMVVLVVGFRYRVGIDTLNYMEIYSVLPNIDNIAYIFDSESNYSYRPLFLLIVVISKLFSNDFYVLQLFHAAILNLCIFIFIFKETRNRFFCVFIYLIIYFFYFNMEIMRESLAVGVFLMSRNALYNRKYLKYAFYVFIASLFHYSAFIMLIYPLAMLLKLDKKFIIIAFSSVFVFIFMKPIIETYLYNAESSLIVSKISNYLEYSNSSFSYISYLVLLTKYTFLPLCILYLLAKYSRMHFKFESLILFHAIIGIGSVFYQIIFARFTNYTLPYVALLYAEFILFAFRRFNMRKMVCVMASISIFIVYILDYNIRPVIGAKRYNQWIPYYSIFYPQRDSLRESIWLKHFE